MTAVLPIEAVRAETVSAWRTHIVALSCAAAAILILFAGDAAGMVRVWWRSATFNHCFLILPIIGWLVWQRLPELRRLTPTAWAPGLALVAAGALAWLIGEAGSVAFFRHAGLVVMLQGAVVACLGKAVARGLVFPLFYAFFLVPVGEELVPPLQTLTADMSMALLALTGIPAHIEGIFISTPSGLFRVAEACSGVRFLVAMAAFAALAANLCFSRWTRRALFVAGALAASVLANGLRAWGTIAVAHLTSNQVAVGFDHLVYGWVFFAIVIGAVMAAAWPFFDRRAADPWFDPQRLQPVRPAIRPARTVQVAAAAVVLAALPPLWAGAVAAAGRTQLPAEPALPEVPGWTRVASTSGWAPHFTGADRVRLAAYRNSRGEEVDLALILFERQDEGRELVGYGQGATAPEGEWSWIAEAPAPSGGKAERIGTGTRIREVVTFYRVGGLLTGNAGAVKIETAKLRLLGRPQHAAAVLVAGDRRSAVDAFLRDAGAVEALADRAAGLAVSR